MKQNHFFAMLSRMKYIDRWGLMCNTRRQNDSEHSLEVAYIAHALGIINNEICGGNVNSERLALLGMYHDATEIITGDMPTPIKYANPDIKDAFKAVEKLAGNELLQGLPEVMQSRFASLLVEDESEKELWRFVKAADKISAYIKCIEERKMGNRDFAQAEITILESINKMDMPEVKYFMENFIPAYDLTIDEAREQ